MNKQWISGAAVTLFSIAVANAASAQERDTTETFESTARRLRPVKNAVELTLGAGYSQAFGTVGSQQPSLTDVNNAGGAVQVGVGYRLIPRLTLGVYGSGAMFGRGTQVDSSAHLYSTTAGFQVDYHFLPGGHEIDPWLSLGTGWRGYWENPNAGVTSLHGWEIARLQVGADYRWQRGVAVSPVIGADLTTFFTEKTPTTGGFTNVASPGVNTFVFAGVQGRFDIPTMAGAATQTARR